MTKLDPAPEPTFWSYADLTQVFGLSQPTLRRRMRRWEREDFPAPLPWSLRAKRWDQRSVLAWKERRELRAKAVPPKRPHVAASS